MIYLRYLGGKIIVMFPKRNIILETESEEKVYHLLKLLMINPENYSRIFRFLTERFGLTEFNEALEIYEDITKISKEIDKKKKNIALNIEEYRSGKKGLASVPYYFEVEISTFCNYNCIYCPRRKIVKSPSNMSLEFYIKNVLLKIPELTTTVVFSGAGEPLMNKDVDLFVQATKNILGDDVRVIILTNGYFLKKDLFLKLLRAGLDEIVISLDTLDPNTYTKLKGVNKNAFYTVMGNVEEIKRLHWLWKDALTITLQFILTRYNVKNYVDIEKFLSFCKTLDMNCKLKLVEDWLGKININDLKLEYEEEKLEGICYQPWKGLFIHVDGKVSPCCYDIAGEYTIGNLKEVQSVLELWNSERILKLREGLLSKNPVGICSACRWYKCL